MHNIVFNYLFGLSTNNFIGNTVVLLNQYTYIIIFLIFIATIIFAKRKYFSIILLILSSVSAWLIAHILKFLFHTARPFTELGITPLSYESSFAFPSEHAAVFSAIAVSMFLINKRAGIGLSILALLVGFSRIILGVHYPIDVLGGFAVGTLIGLLYIKLFKKL